MLFEGFGGGILIKISVGFEHHECGQPLSVLFIVDADHRGLRDFGMGSKGLFHLDRVDVLSSGDDHFVVAPDHEQPSVAVQEAHVARRHEAGVEILGGARCVSVELAVVADKDAADLALRHFVEFLVQDPDFGSFGGAARGVGCGTQVCRRRGGDHPGLGRVVVVVDHVAESVHERDDDVGAHPGTGRRGKPQCAAAVAVEHLGGQFHDAVEHHRHHHQAGRPMAVDEVQRRFRVELAAGDDRACQ